MGLQRTGVALRMHLNRMHVSKLVQSFLEEDVGAVDYCQCDDIVVTAEIVAKDPGVMCGTPFIQELFELLHCQTLFLVPEGEQFEAKTVLIKIIGKAVDVLNGERTSLNILARTIGIATNAKRLITMISSRGWKGRLAGTRKTTPGFRLCEKYALFIGGVDTHRISLQDCCMIKDNHLAIHADCVDYVHNVKKELPFTMKLEVETSTMEDALCAARHADIVMLDNVSPEEAHEISVRVKLEYPCVLIEVSGGINEHNLEQYLWPTVDIISMGALTMQYRMTDLSLRITD